MRYGAFLCVFKISSSSNFLRFRERPELLLMVTSILAVDLVDGERGFIILEDTADIFLGFFISFIVILNTFFELSFY